MLAGDTRRLGTWIDGRFVGSPEASDEVVPAERFLDPDYLRYAVDRVRETSVPASGVDLASRPDLLGADGEGDAQVTADLRIATSRFTRTYAAAVSYAALLALGRGVGVDLSPASCRIVFWRNVPYRVTLDGGDEALRCAERPTSWPVRGPAVETIGELRGYVWGKLYGEHLAPLWGLLQEVAGAPEKVTWTNTAEPVGVIADAAEKYLGPAEAEPFVADCVALLETEALPGVAGPNPLRHRLDWVPVDVPGTAPAVQTRDCCCLTYLLPVRLGRLCANCPFLPANVRAQLFEEMRELGGTHDGPTGRLALKYGLAKLRKAKHV